MPLIRESMLGAAALVHATILGVVEHQFDPHGVSVVVVIAESHLSIHTWPEHGYAAADVFTCGHNLVSEQVVDHLRESLGAQRAVSMEVKRGQLADAPKKIAPVAEQAEPLDERPDEECQSVAVKS